MERVLKLIWNAKGLLQKLDQLELFIGEKNINVCYHPSNKVRGESSLYEYIKESIEYTEDLKIEPESVHDTCKK